MPRTILALTICTADLEAPYPFFIIIDCTVVSQSLTDQTVKVLIILRRHNGGYAFLSCLAPCL